MALEQTRDDSSHYEVSLTAGQAFIAFVLLLFSLAASFAFGVIIGKERNSEPMIARGDSAVVSPARRTADSSGIVERGEQQEPPLRIIEEAPPASAAAAPAREPQSVTAPVTSTAGSALPAIAATQPEAATQQPAAGDGPWYAQLLSTSDAKSAESLAARLIDNGYTSAYVQRNAGEQGNVFRVRVRFPDERAARAAATPLKEYSKGEIWVTRQ